MASKPKAELTKEDLKKKIKKKNLIIAFLSIILAVFIYLALDNSVGLLPPGNGGPHQKSYKEALDQTTKFKKKRVQWRKPAYGVYYDTGAFRAFIDSFSSIVDSENKAKIGKNDTLRWVIGFYWMMTPDSADQLIPKHDFCIAPTLVSKNYPKDVKDYFSSKDSQWYNHRDSTAKKFMAKRRVLLTDGDGSAYDVGTLWP
jgi:hypothetical protein